DDRDALIDEATMAALTQFDETLRELALQRYREFEREMGTVLTRFAVEETIRRFGAADLLHWPEGVSGQEETGRLIEELTPQYGLWLSKHPALEDVAKLTQAVAGRLAERRAFSTWYRLTEASFQALQKDGVPAALVKQLKDLKEKTYTREDDFLKALRPFLSAEEWQRYRERLLRHAAFPVEASSALQLRPWLPRQLFDAAAEALGAERRTFDGEVLKALEKRRTEL